MSTTPVNRIVLLTMVKNEEKNMRRLISSLAAWIDGVVICDTGSTDSTVELTNTLLKEFKLPGTVAQYPWENFGKSRTKSFEAFQRWVKESTDWAPEYTWALLLDADMVLGTEGGLKAAVTKLDSSIAGVQIPQKNGSIIYKNTRLLKSSESWKCIGSTHEYWSCDGGKPSSSFEFPVITDIGDGGCKADKFTRDAALLEADLKTDPNNVRTWFYLGQTYMSLSKNQEAVDALTKRIQLGGWEEEIYISHLYKGDCLKYLGRPTEAVDEWLRAWQVRQHRTEAALRLINYYRVSPNRTFVAMTYLEKLLQLQLGETLDGKKVWNPVTNNDILFVSHHDMMFPVWEELGIIAFYTGHREAARLRLDKAMLYAANDFNHRNRLIDLYRWYAWKLPVTKRTALTLDPAHLDWVNEGFWKSFNPSVWRESDRYLVNLRTANYHTTNAKHYEYRGKHGLIVTRNVVLEMDRDLNVLTDRFAPIETVVPEKYVVNKSTNIHGIEDCRWLGTNSLLGTTRQFGPTDLNKMIRIDIDNKTKSLVRMKPLMSPVPSEENDCQKNWMPFIWKGEEAIVYKINPFTVYTMKGKNLMTWTAKNGFTFDGFRGSAPPVAWKSAAYPNEELILVCHFSFYGGEGRRYYHRFITVNNDLTPSRLSRVFTLTDDAIQYVSGMCVSLLEGHYVVTYGINDSQAWAIEVDAKVIEGAMTYAL